MNFVSRKFSTFLAIMVVSIFIFIILFGVNHTLGMEMRGDGTMSGCLFDGKAEICLMTFSDHLSRWQGMFTTIPQKADPLITLFLLILIFSAFLLSNLRRRLLLLLFNCLFDRWRLYLKQNPHLSLFNHLQEAFSQGILNPKIYNSATL